MKMKKILIMFISLLFFSSVFSLIQYVSVSSALSPFTAIIESKSSVGGGGPLLTLVG